MTNGDNGDRLWREILNSVSMESGWVRNNTYLYVGATPAVAFILLGSLALRRTRAADTSSVRSRECVDQVGLDHRSVVRNAQCCIALY
jgi:hypothetical protein